MKPKLRMLLLGAGLLALPAAALAHTDVFVGIGVPGAYYAPPPPVYYAPPPAAYYYGPTVGYSDEGWRWRHYHRDWDDRRWHGEGEGEWHHHHHRGDD